MNKYFEFIHIFIGVNKVPLLFDRIAIMKKRFPKCPICNNDGVYEPSIFYPNIKCLSCKAEWFLHTDGLELKQISKEEWDSELLNKKHDFEYWKDPELKRKLIEKKQKVSSPAKSEWNKRISTNLDLILYFVFLGAWFLLSNVKLSPLYSGLSVDKASNISGNVIEALGILIGFTGLSAFFFLGKIGELSVTLSTKTVEATNFWAECMMGYQSSVREIQNAEAEIALCNDISKKEKKMLKKSSTKLRTTSEQALSDLEELDKKIYQLSELSIKYGGIMIKWQSLPSIFTISFFVVSLIATFLSVLTETHTLLKFAIDFMVIGIALLIFNLYIQHRHIGEIRENVGSFESMIIRLIGLRTKIENIKAENKSLRELFGLITKPK